MKKVPNRNQFSKILGLSLIAFLLFVSPLIAQDEPAADDATTEVAAGAGDAKNGKALFNQNCAACHALNRKMTGPALENVESRLSEDEGLGKEWLYAWIKNSPGVIKSGDAYANKLYAEYNQAAMTAFPTLSDSDIDDILAYTAAAPAAAPAPAAGDAQAAATTTGSAGVSNEIILE